MSFVFNPITGKLDLATKIGDPIGGTNKSILFVDSSGQLAQDNPDFIYDSSTKILTANQYKILTPSSANYIQLMSYDNAGNTNGINRAGLYTETGVIIADYDRSSSAARLGSSLLVASSQTTMSSNTLRCPNMNTGATRALVIASNGFVTASTIDLTSATQVTGILPVANGGTNAGAFTSGSVVFAGAGGTYTEDNSNFSYNSTTKTLSLSGSGTFNKTNGSNNFTLGGSSASGTTDNIEVKDTVSSGGYTQFGIWGAATNTNTYYVVRQSTNLSRFFYGLDSGGVGRINCEGGPITLFQGNFPGTQVAKFSTSGNVINETGADIDFRVEGDTDQNLVFVDASTDRVGIGNATPSYKLDVTGQARFTNGIVERTNTVTSSATPSINTDTTDIFTITALAAAITSMSTNLSGTPVNGQKLTIRILDNGTARAITWGASFASRGATLPTTTVISKYLYVGLIYNSTTSTWDCVATAQEA